MTLSEAKWLFEAKWQIDKSPYKCRGTKTRDPFSPYLFILCSQGLSSILTSFANENMIHGVKMARGSPVITHFFFVNDRLVFFQTTREDVENVKWCLLTYEKALGKLVNYDKPVITFNALIPSSNIRYINDTLQMQVC